jgi:hypothetical protein
MTSYCVALAALTERIGFQELAQVAKHFAPAWGASAVIAAVAPEAIPAGYCPIFIQDALDTDGADGFHRTSADDSPYIVIPFGRNWSLAAGHELLRFLGDPTGAARLPGPSCMLGQGLVEYLVDVTAPCRDIAQAYAIDGVVVPDFCLPAFYDEHATGPCSFTGSLRHPLRPAAGGAVTWLADDGLLYQARREGQRDPKVHGGFSCANRGGLMLRELVDRQAPRLLRSLANAPTPARLREAEQDAKRARLTNLMRFRDDMGWRFGHARVPAEAVVERLAARNRDYVSARSGQQPASGELCTTERTAS